ncbi:MAG: hypothetical protein BWX61_01081 [Bacteroidetes bacterium ADurb.Bin035]|nr:MAG: hypothetical protein BWX61_01081 [Bacteroidetes bacterium ADurb.Bin035]
MLGDKVVSSTVYFLYGLDSMLIIPPACTVYLTGNLEVLINPSLGLVI